jgi:hypothetical protein
MEGQVDSWRLGSSFNKGERRAIWIPDFVTNNTTIHILRNEGTWILSTLSMRNWINQRRP